MAPVLLSSRLAHLFLPPMRGINCARRHRLEMKKLIRNMMLVAMLGMVSTGVMAQKRDQDKRPPKEPVKVITNDRKDNKPPQQNPPPKRDDKKKPN